MTPNGEYGPFGSRAAAKRAADKETQYGMAGRATVYPKKLSAYPSNDNRRVTENPLSSGAKLAVGIGAAVAVFGGLAYFLTRPAKAADALPPAATAQPPHLSIPAQLTSGKRYQLVGKVAAGHWSARDQDALTTQLQPGIDAAYPGEFRVVSAQSSSANGTVTVRVVFDVVGPNFITPEIPAGGSLTTVDGTLFSSVVVIEIPK